MVSWMMYQGMRKRKDVDVTDRFTRGSDAHLAGIDPLR